jgi:hypothetical protein
MKLTSWVLAGLFVATAITAAGEATAQTSSAIPPQLITPDRLETSLGTLEFKDGAPSKETIGKVYDYLDLMHGVEAFVNAYQGASVASIVKGFHDAGVPDNTAMIWSELMDSKSLALTGNADTVYFWVNFDLTKGPMVLESPPMSLAAIDDMWFRWITDVGLSGPDRGEGGRYLLVPPGYTGQLPDSGYFVNRARTNRVTMYGRSFLENNDPKPTVALIKKTLKVYPYARGLRHEHRHGTRWKSQADADARGQAGMELPAAAAAREVHRRHWQGHEHDRAERFQLLRNHQ